MQNQNKKNETQEVRALINFYAEVYFNCAVNMGLGRAREFPATANGNADKFLDRTAALRKHFGIS